jgi:DNA polymerase
LGDEPEDEDEPGEGISLEALSLPENAERALRIRQTVGSSSIKKLESMRACTCDDGKARGLLSYHGTGPGRSTGSLLQPTNFPRPTIDVDQETLVNALLTGDAAHVQRVICDPAQAKSETPNRILSPIDAVISGLRHAIVAGPGKVLLDADYAGIQARLVLTLAGQYDKVALMASGADVYSDMASLIFKFKVNKKDHPEERQIGKNCVLGLGFGLGEKQFQIKMARKSALEFCGTCVKVYRKEWAPEVPNLWKGLFNAATRCVWTGERQEAYGCFYEMEGQWLVATAPCSSKIYYFNPKRTRRPVPWDETDIRPGFTFQAYKQGKVCTIDAHGGLLTENIVMRMEASINANAQHKLEAAGFPVVLEVYDQIICEVDEKDVDVNRFRSIMEDMPQWVLDLKAPIVVDEPNVGKRWRK